MARKTSVRLVRLKGRADCPCERILSDGRGRSPGQQAPAAEQPRTRGTAVFAVFTGMLGVTLFGIFLPPVFYYVIQWFKDLRPERRREEADAVRVQPGDLALPR